MVFLLGLYIILGYWATGLTSHANKIIISTRPGEMFFQRLMAGCCFGWILIPIAILRKIFKI